MKNKDRTIRSIVDYYLELGMGKDHKNEKASMVRWISDIIKDNFKNFLNDKLNDLYLENEEHNTREKMYIKEGGEILVKNLIRIYPYKSFTTVSAKKLVLNKNKLSKKINVYKDEKQIIEMLRSKLKNYIGILEDNEINISKDDLDSLESKEINITDYELHLGNLELSIYSQIYELKASLRQEVLDPFLNYKLAYLYSEVGEKQKAFDSINLAIDNFINIYNKNEKIYKEKDVTDFNKFASIMFDMEKKYEGYSNISPLLKDKNDDDVNYTDNPTFCIFFPQHLFVLKNEIISSLLDSLNNFKIDNEDIEDESNRKINSEKYTENEQLKGRYKEEYYQTFMDCFYWSVKTYDPVFSNSFLLSNGASKLFYNYLCEYSYEKNNFPEMDKGIFLSLYKLIKDSKYLHLFGTKEYFTIMRDIYKGETFENSEVLFYIDLIKTLAKISPDDAEIELDFLLEFLNTQNIGTEFFDLIFVTSNIGTLIVEYKGIDEYERIYIESINDKVNQYENIINNLKKNTKNNLKKKSIFEFKKMLAESFIKIHSKYSLSGDFFDIKKEKLYLMDEKQKQKRRKKEQIKALFENETYNSFLSYKKENIEDTDDLIQLNFIISLIEIINDKRFKKNVENIKLLILDEDNFLENDDNISELCKSTIDNIRFTLREIKEDYEKNGLKDLDLQKKHYFLYPLNESSIKKALTKTSFDIELFKAFRITALGGYPEKGVVGDENIEIKYDINFDDIHLHPNGNILISYLTLKNGLFHIEHIKELIHLTRDRISKSEDGCFTKKDYEALVDFYLSLKSKMIYTDIV